MLAVLACTSAFQVPAPTRGAPSRTRHLTASASSRRAILFAAPMAAAVCGESAAHAFNPLDIVFGWIPEVGCTSGDKSCGKAAAATDKPQELSNAEKIRRRRAQLEQEEQAKLMAEYQKNQSNRAASRATDASGAR
jgi:hypothetical protein